MDKRKILLKMAKAYIMGQEELEDDLQLKQSIQLKIDGMRELLEFLEEEVYF